MDRRPPRRRRPGWPLVVLLFAAIGGFGWLGARTTQPPETVADPVVTQSTPPAPQLEPTPPAPLNPFGASPVYVLLVGTDVDVSRGRTDTMIVLAADIDRRAVAMLSVPRDTKIDIGGYGAQKINAAFPIGGRKLCAQAVANVIRKPIHAFLHCDLKAFQEAVDAVGGVTVDVEKRMSYRDRAQNLRIDLQPGPQRLDGAHAMQYVRFRKDKLGDLGRIRRQQTFLKAVAKELCRPEQIPKLPAVVQALGRNMETTMSVTQVLYLAKLIAQVGPDKLATGQLPGEAHYIDGISYFLAAETSNVAVDDLLASAPGADDDATAATSPSGLAPAVTIYNGSDRLGLERVVADQLADQGIASRSATMPTPEQVAESRVYAVSMDDHEAAARFGGVIGVAASSNTAPPKKYPPIAEEAGHPQLVLVLGADFKPSH